MHILQSKHTKLNEKEAKELLEKFNIALTQLPKISKKDSALPEGCDTGDIVKVSRADEEYYRIVI